MRIKERHIGWWLGGIIMLLLTVACASDPKEVEEDPLPKEPSVLKIYIFAPDKPIVTRADIGDVDASADEAAINTLDVWVFEHNDAHTPVGHVHQSNISWEGQKEVAIEVDDDFAQRKPNVDIYVTANVAETNCGISLDRNAAATNLKAALLEHKDGGGDFFGLTSPVTSVPIDGLPMSGVLTNQSVTGTAPVFTAKTQYVRLVRAVSKMRFIFSNSEANQQDINSLAIQLDGKVLPKQEYLFLNGIYPTVKSNVVGGGIEETFDDAYVSEAYLLVSGKTKDDIANSSGPAQFAFGSVENETGQAYENRINDGLKEEKNDAGEVISPAELSELGRFYLRESDRQLKGTIDYKIGEESKSKPFVMNMAGDFTRNHTWIVYGYFMGSGELVLNVVDVKAWTVEDAEHTIYNW